MHTSERFISYHCYSNDSTIPSQISECWFQESFLFLLVLRRSWALLKTLYFKIPGRRSWYSYIFLFCKKFPLFLSDKDIFQIVFHDFLCCYKIVFISFLTNNMSLLFKHRQLRSKKHTVAVHSVYNYPCICCQPPSIKYEEKMTSSGKNNSKYIFFFYKY